MFKSFKSGIALLCCGSFLGGPFESFLGVDTLEAREVDQYMGWGHPLSDSGKKIDEQLKIFFLQGLIALNHKDSKGKLSCEEAIITLKKDFFRPTYQLIEEWIDHDPSIDRYPSRLEMDDASYTRNSHIVRQPFWVPLARGVKVYGIYAGADKFGHFTSFGSHYAEKYWKAKKKMNKLPSEEAHKKALTAAVEYGFFSERTFVGKLATGVLSYADLEANYQGLLFTLEFCKENSKHPLKYDRSAGEWSIDHFEAISLRDYVNPDWDETFNNSRYAFYKWDDTSEVFANKYCLEIGPKWKSIEERFNTYYARYTPSLNKMYQKEFEKDLPEDERQEAHDLFTFCKIPRPTQP
jgi:hypothetical protein